MKELIMTVEVVDETGKEVDEQIRKAVMESRNESCDILNGPNGAIEKYNELIETLDLDTNDDIYIETYEKLVNASWSRLLQKKGFDYIILSEYIKETKNIFNLIKGVNYECTIKIKKA